MVIQTLFEKFITDNAPPVPPEAPSSEEAALLQSVREMPAGTLMTPEQSAAISADMGRRIVAQTTQYNRYVMRRVVPLGLVTLTAIIASQYLDHQSKTQAADAAKAYDCVSFDPDILKPPTDGRIGFKIGDELDQEDLPTDGMVKSETDRRADGNPVMIKNLGHISNQGGKLKGELSLGDGDEYGSAILSALREDNLRWGVCLFDDGIKVTGTDTPAAVNGEYITHGGGRGDAAQLTFAVGTEDRLYDHQNDVANVLGHEIGHGVMARILEKGTDQRSVELINRLDRLYVQQTRLGLEEYRVAHRDQITADLGEVQRQFDALDGSIIGQSGKQHLARAIAHINSQLEQVDGLADAALLDADAELYGEKYPRLLKLDEMITKALNATADKNADGQLVSIQEYFSDYPDKLNQKPAAHTAELLKEFMKQRIVTEEVMPGNRGGHAHDGGDESRATYWVVTGAVDARYDDQILGNRPEPHRSLIRAQLETMRELRNGLDPNSLKITR